MIFEKRMRQAVENAGEIKLRSEDKLVIMSDLHRGVGNGNDNFAKNYVLFEGALCYYYQKGYFYLELGDADELWENPCIEDVRKEYPCVFEMLEKLQKEKRYFQVFGNHDNRKRKWENVKESYFVYTESGRNALLALHGHQGDTLNDTLGKLAAFLVRFVWGPLERLGVQNPTEGSLNKKMRSKQERRLISWAKVHGQPVIAGHTHAEWIASPGEPPYYNCGCGVKRGQITAIEIDKEKLILVKWQIVPDCQGYMKITRKIVKEANFYGE